MRRPLVLAVLLLLVSLLVTGNPARGQFIQLDGAIPSVSPQQPVDHETTCIDGYDNDDDGAADAEDPDDCDLEENDGVDDEGTDVSTCSDGYDNDDDGAADDEDPNDCEFQENGGVVP